MMRGHSSLADSHALLEGKPLSARCTFLAYDAVRELAELKHLEHLSDSVIEEYEEGTLV